MDYSKPMVLQSGWGNLYQGAAADVGIQQIEPHLWVVCMNYGEVDDGLIDRKGVDGLEVRALMDAPEDLMDDREILSNVEADIARLKRGLPQINHCGAGISRASYRSLPTIMHVRKLTFDDALTYLRAVRPQAGPNSGFTDHLRRLQPMLLQEVLP